MAALVLAWGMHYPAPMAGFKSPEEFRAWQFAWELKERVYAFSATAPAADDRRFCEAIREAARSAPDNIAEGCYRFSPPDFANFVRIARGSVGEVRNQLLHARSKQYLTDNEFREALQLCNRALGATAGLRRYLLTLPRDFDPRKNGSTTPGDSDQTRPVRLPRS